MIILKTKEEIEHIRKASRIAARVLKETGKIIRPGITTQEIDAFAEKLLREKRAIPAFKGYRGYRHATCLSVNDEVVHGIPGSRRLKEGDIIGVDVGAVADGFYGDVAATFPVGKTTKRIKELLKATQEALQLAIKEARVGKHLGDVSWVIENHAKKYGFSVIRDLFGHGVGRELHEEPLVPNFGERGQGPRLEEGMVFAIEPMLNTGEHKIKTKDDGWTVVTMDHGWSAHFEHTMAVRKNKGEVLSKE